MISHMCTPTLSTISFVAQCYVVHLCSVFRREIPGEWSRVRSGSVPLKQGAVMESDVAVRPGLSLSYITIGNLSTRGAGLEPRHMTPTNTHGQDSL